FGRTAQPPANPAMTARAILRSLLSHQRHLSSPDLSTSRLTGLATDLLAFVLDPLAQVRFGRTDLADVRGELTELFLARALEGDLGRAVRHFRGDPFRHRHDHRVVVPDVDLEIVARLGGAPTGPDDLERAGVALV